MAKRKRSEVEEDIRKLGDISNLEKLSYSELLEKLKNKDIVLPVKAKPVVPKTFIDVEIAKNIIGNTKLRMSKMVDYYSSDDEAGTTGEDALIPERIITFLDKSVKESENLKEAEYNSDRALQKLHIHLLKLWSDGSISGPNSERNIQNRVHKFRKMAEYLRKIGKEEYAKNQDKKAEEALNVTRKEFSAW